MIDTYRSVPKRLFATTLAVVLGNNNRAVDRDHRRSMDLVSPPTHRTRAHAADRKRVAGCSDYAVSRAEKPPTLDPKTILAYYFGD